MKRKFDNRTYFSSKWFLCKELKIQEENLVVKVETNHDNAFIEINGKHRMADFVFDEVNALVFIEKNVDEVQQVLSFVDEIKENLAVDEID